MCVRGAAQPGWPDSLAEEEADASPDGLSEVSGDAEPVGEPDGVFDGSGSALGPKPLK